MKTKDFQEATANRIIELLTKEKQRRVLLADEVGLGKTIIANAVVEKLCDHHEANGDDHFKVAYICSNINIARQNMDKLGIDKKLNPSESRLSMAHLALAKIEKEQHDNRIKMPQTLIPLTPATSFSIGNSRGTRNERALMFVLLKDVPALSQFETELDALLKFQPNLGWWGEAKDRYSLQIKDETLPKYKANMTKALSAEAEMLGALIGYFNSTKDAKTQIELICFMRKTFAKISVQSLDPDLVIMDEFQRYRALISENAESETGMIVQSFLRSETTQVLLLSATPYKTYSTLEELSHGGENHYDEFMEVMDFLFYEPQKNKQYKIAWKDFSSALYELNSDSFSVLKMLPYKEQAEKLMYGGVCRTERFSTGIICDKGAKEIDITEQDIRAYVEAQKLLDELGVGQFPVEYAKSSPYILSFLDGYKLKNKIFNADTVVLKKRLSTNKSLILRKDDIRNYKEISANNARLAMLKQKIFVQDKLQELLWLPASNPYYPHEGVYKGKEGASKYLVFSSWAMVPKMLATMLSYESERIAHIKGKYSYFADRRRKDENDKSKAARRIAPQLTKEREDLLVYPSPFLASLFSSEHYGKSLKEIKKIISKTIEEKVVQRFGNDLEIKGAGAKSYLDLMKALDDVTLKITELPHDYAEVLTLLAIGSPAVCAYRLFKDSSLAATLAKEGFVRLFDKEENITLIEMLYKRSADFYYIDILNYCVDGNLQAVLDEYNYALGKTDAKELCDIMVSAFLQTSNVQVDTYEHIRDNTKDKTNMRTHFAVGYYNAKTDDKAINRGENIRTAFNSPFRPFVLATTSIGQEGLDFHLYCRKVVHWNLPTNPIDLEQREGRINRYMCLAIRQNIARLYGGDGTWADMFEKAKRAQDGAYSEMVPFWCLPSLDDGLKIERIVPMYPFSRDRERYDRLIKIVSHYRMSLGQPRQEEFIENVMKGELSQDELNKLFINLSPYDHEKDENIL